MRSRFGFALAAYLVVFLQVGPAGATEIIQLSFDQVVNRAQTVVEGTVVDLQIKYTGTDIRAAKAKRHIAPRVEPSTLSPGPAVAVPQSVGVEGGQMLFTEVTLAVNTAILGDAEETLTFRVAGGEDEHGKVTVYGMPTFKTGQRYVVFLRPGFTQTGTPLVGVNQGFFEVTQQDDGREVVLTAAGDFLIGVEDHRLLTRHNPKRSNNRLRRLAAPPVPDDASVVAQPSTAVRRYWTSTQAPLDLDSFISVIRATREVAP